MAQWVWTVTHHHFAEMDGKSGADQHTQAGSQSRPAIFHDPRLKVVQWRDLVHVRSLEVLTEPLLPAAWLVASLVMAGTGRYLIALGFSFFFFLTGLRLVHNAFHGALGLSRRSTDIVLWIMSFVMLGSMHAVQFNHLRHHKLSLGEGDVEGRSAEMPAWRALLFGPIFPILLHVTAFRYGHRKLRMIVLAELLLSAVWVLAVFGALHSNVLRYHVSAMLAGQCMTAFFAVWTVHHHCDRTHHLARTLHNRIKNRITFNMFLHIEHHLFPRVPTCHLPELSRRIDRVAPDLRSKIVF
jgi:fatty acid desaturase